MEKNVKQIVEQVIEDVKAKKSRTRRIPSNC